jgi:hypothetical protein
MSRLGHLQSFNMNRLGHLQSSLSRPSDWKITTGRCMSMLIQNMASVVVFELHRTCSHFLSGCIGHRFPLVTVDPKMFFKAPGMDIWICSLLVHLIGQWFRGRSCQW